MREIKFRGKRVDNGEWVFGDLIHRNEMLFINVYKTDFGYYAYEVPAVTKTVGQFTGLKDVADKEIYEGDIVRVYYNGYEETSIHEVRYMIDESYPAFDLVPIISFADSNSLQYAFTIYTIEVIGNIHDQKEETI